MALRKESPEVHAGSMADIAFLLLIFFLVTTVIETDVGLDRKLPRLEEDTVVLPRHKRNVLPILLDSEGRILVKEKLIPIAELKKEAIAFLDNGGLPNGDPDFCSYCKGKKDPGSSDNPAEAIISISSHRKASYGAYILVQNELIAAYNALRNREAQRLYETDYTALQSLYDHPQTASAERELLKKKIQHIQGLYPLNLIDAEIK